jgi:ATP-dependent DNA helicase RecG
MARFKGTNKLGDFIDNQQLYGNSFRILSEADAFLRRHLPIASFFKPDQFKRIDKPALPVLAVREALINAICHRDYSDLYTDISFAVYDDRLEIWNSGTLLKNLTVDNLKHKHESILRNKLIANAFYVRGWIEKWGSGTNKMIDLCNEDSIPEPSFEEYSGGFSVMFRFKEPISITQQVASLVQSLSIRQEEILIVIRTHKSANIQQIIKELKDPPSQRMVQKDLHVLRAQGLIDLKGIGKMRRWELKGSG